MVDANACNERCHVTWINMLSLIVRVDGYTHTHHMWWISKKTKLRTKPNITSIVVKPPGTGTNRQKDAQRGHMGAPAGPRPSLTPNRSGGFPGVASVMELGDEKARFMGEAKEQRLTLNNIHISRCACECVCLWINTGLHVAFTPTHKMCLAQHASILKKEICHTTQGRNSDNKRWNWIFFCSPEPSNILPQLQNIIFYAIENYPIIISMPPQGDFCLKELNFITMVTAYDLCPRSEL